MALKQVIIWSNVDHDLTDLSLNCTMTDSNPDFSNPEAQKLMVSCQKGPTHRKEGNQVSSGQLPSSAQMSLMYLLMASCQKCSVPGVTAGTVADHSIDIMQKKT